MTHFSVRPELVEGVFMVRQAYHEWFQQDYETNFAQILTADLSVGSPASLLAEGPTGMPAILKFTALLEEIARIENKK